MRHIRNSNLYETCIEVDLCNYDSYTLVFKDVELSVHSYCALYHKKNYSENNKFTLLNLFSYYLCKPCFLCVDNIEQNNKLQDLYLRFEIADLLYLRDKLYYKTTIRYIFEQLNPKFITGNDWRAIIGEIPHFEVLEFYNASLKQFEPFPRCVFLFRIFEYGANHHFKPMKRPSEYNVIDALNYYVEKIKSFSYMPLYFLDTGLISYDCESPVQKKEPELFDFFEKLKSESKQILDEWMSNEILKNMSPGEIIYITGRNSIAHGGKPNSRVYDYTSGYKLINEVNILLELISRMIIEILNPEIKTIIEYDISQYNEASY
jgi:hypothetical protein